MPKTTKKRVNSKNKGNAFERQIATELSLWWTEGIRDDIFYRSASSGARSTSRMAAGKTTANSGGDISFLDSLGEPLISWCSIEIKRGYSTCNAQTVLERLPGSKASILEDWIKQAVRSQQDSGAHSWLIIAKKNRAKTVVFLPLLDYMLATGFVRPTQFPYMILANILCPEPDGDDETERHIVCMPLADFFASVKPKDIIGCVKSLKVKSVRQLKERGKHE